MIVVDRATGKGMCRTCKWLVDEQIINDEVCRDCTRSFIDSEGVISKNWEAREGK